MFKILFKNWENYLIKIYFLEKRLQIHTQTQPKELNTNYSGKMS